MLTHLLRLVMKRLADQLANLGLEGFAKNIALDLHSEAIDVLRDRARMFLTGKKLVDATLAC
ncbi:protein of unknown function (plasmid) [Cupriavidus taiwanensis]|uniref:Uncharacterized protein n=1 Tax=Cupriavidus taiwanensis TaxID=164546 RepID=A0A375HCP1_9BURK|nr:protein of unknown function [Cupriavidus taiwanensis]SPD48706.1 protein of unknown function [Cupriavidus taiwanensis]